MSANEIRFIPRSEEDEIGRGLTTWINTFPDLPDGLYKGGVLYELLSPSGKAMALSTVQGTYITQPDITGGYEAEYQFKIIYRMKPGDSINSRLDADELLNRLGDWASKNMPDLGEEIHVTDIEQTTRSSLFAPYESGEEDHQIFLKLNYWVQGEEL